MSLASEDYAFIKRRLDEIRAERATHSGVLNTPLPEVAAPEDGDGDDTLNNSDPVRF